MKRVTRVYRFRVHCKLWLWWIGCIGCWIESISLFPQELSFALAVKERKFTNFFQKTQIHTRQKFNFYCQCYTPMSITLFVVVVMVQSHKRYQTHSKKNHLSLGSIGGDSIKCRFIWLVGWLLCVLLSFFLFFPPKKYEYFGWERLAGSC